MNSYIQQLTESSYITNRDYLDGLMAGLDAAIEASVDSDLKASKNPELLELRDFVLARTNELSKKVQPDH